MIPIKLELQAFGPFAKQQIIDFTKLCESRLFLISGQTGSGKTTIFDAISFALFGQPSGSVRSTDGLKSHFADDATECYVRFTFSIHGETYTVYREPPQNKLRRNGAVTKSLPVAELTLSDGEIIGSIKSVNDKINDLIGLDCEQFRKIAMLPQGEFRRFLSEKTSDKQTTLREIFKTQQLDQFTKRLSEKVSFYKQKLIDIGNVMQGSINNISFLHNEQLQAECEKGNANIIAISQALSEDLKSLELKKQGLSSLSESLESEIKSLNLPYYLEINQSFQELEKNQNQLAILEKQSDYFDKQAKRLDFLNKVKLVIPLSKQTRSLENSLNSLQGNIETLSLEGNKLAEEHELLKPRLDDIQSRAKNTNGLISKIEQLKHKQLIFEKVESIKAELANCELQLSKRNQAKSELLRYILMLQLKSDMQQYQDLCDKVSNAISLCKQKFTTQVEYIKISDEYKTAFNRFMSCQASLLSLTLKDDSPCPVCGSKIHPEPAKDTVDSITESELDVIKTKFNDITKQLEQISAKSDTACIALEVENCDIAKLNELLERYTGVYNEKFKELSQYSDLKANTTLEAVKERLLAVEQAIVAIEQDILNCKKQITENEQQISSTDTKEVIEKNISILQSEINEINTQNEHITKQYNDVFSSKKSNETAIEQAKKYLETQSAELAKVKFELSEKLKQSNISLENLNVIDDSNNIESEISSIASEFDEYHDSMVAVKSIIKSLTVSLNGKEPVNIIALQEKNTHLTEQLDNVRAELTQLNHIFTLNSSISNSIAQYINDYKITEEQYKQYNEIYSVANGSKSDRITFESYILSYYFNQVIENANIRLAQMTNKRYTIFIRQEKEKYGAYSGLELNVLDSYTGKQRDVATLSGGESFKLALALSLALADITTEHSGGVEINTLFIDEGFGSLDPDSITSAIECLNSLQLQGRYVGVISHVAELKEKISSKIIVNQFPSGSNLQLEF